MTASQSSVAVSSSQANKPDENGDSPQEKDEARKALKVLARFILKNPQLSKSNKQQMNLVELEDALFDKKGRISTQSTLDKDFEVGKKIRKPDHNFLIEQRSEIQYLVDFHSSRVELREFPTDPFSRHQEVFRSFRLILLDKEPVTKLVLCTKCRKILVRYRPSGTNLIRHAQRHIKLEK